MLWLLCERLAQACPRVANAARQGGGFVRFLLVEALSKVKFAGRIDIL